MILQVSKIIKKSLLQISKVKQKRITPKIKKETILQVSKIKKKRYYASKIKKNGIIGF